MFERGDSNAEELVPTGTRNTPNDPPQLNGQLFHLFDSPNRFGLDPFYTLCVGLERQSKRDLHELEPDRVV